MRRQPRSPSRHQGHEVNRGDTFIDMMLTATIVVCVIVAILSLMEIVL